MRDWPEDSVRNCDVGNEVRSSITRSHVYQQRLTENRTELALQYVCLFRVRRKIVHSYLSRLL